MPIGPQPDYGLYLLGQRQQVTTWPSTWLRWPDFWLPSDPETAVDAIRDLHRRADTERVEVACGGGVGRTGTVLAACAVLDGLPPAEAVRFVRQRYHRRAVETPWQRAFLRRLG
jgi:protein-tyrosine phosphatase